MKRIFLMMLLVLLPSSAFTEEIKLTVKGMVCSFCAQGIKKNFSKLPEVESVSPDLEKKLVVIKTKDSTTLSDEKIKEVISDAGYSITNIERTK